MIKSELLMSEHDISEHDISERDISKQLISGRAISKQAVNEQQRLLDAIWCNGQSESALHGFSRQGINIYRRNLLANAQRSLSISFPTVFELLDSDISKRLVRPFLQLSPPVHGDWAQWGSQFSAFLSVTEVGRDYPYLADSAELDWHVHQALHGKDQTLEQSSLQLLANCEPEHIFIEFNQNVRLLCTRYPVAEIFHAHHHEDATQRDAALDSAKQALALAPIEHLVMTYRPEYQPMVSKLTQSEGNFMRALMAGESLTASLNIVSDDASFSFEKWLLTAIERNLIHYFKEH